MPDLIAYVGTYTRHGAAGIYRLRIGSADGQLSALDLVAATEDPSFLALHPTLPLLYAVNETLEFGGEPTGSVSAFAIAPGDGTLRLLNRIPSHGRWPAHVSVNAAGTALLVANYFDPTIAAIGLERDGSLSPSISVLRHDGRGPHIERQASAHPHAITLDRRNAFAFVADLGADKVVAYRFDTEHGRFSGAPELTVTARPGSGPRRLIFDATCRRAFLMCELSSEVVAFDYDEAAGRLSERQSVSTLPKDFHGENTSAELVLHPNGRLLFATNRGHDSLAVYDVDDSGTLTLRTHLPSGGRTPRHLAIDRSGHTLLVSNQDSNNLTVYHLDASARAFTRTATIAVPAPVCALFLDASPSC